MVEYNVSFVDSRPQKSYSQALQVQHLPLIKIVDACTRIEFSGRCRRPVALVATAIPQCSDVSYELLPCYIEAYLPRSFSLKNCVHWHKPQLLEKQTIIHVKLEHRLPFLLRFIFYLLELCLRTSDSQKALTEQFDYFAFENRIRLALAYFFLSESKTLYDIGISLVIKR